MRRAHLVEGFASVIGPIHARIQDVHRIGRLRIGKNMRIVPGALTKPVVVGHQMPRIPTVVGTVDSAFLGLNHRPHPIGIRPGNRDPNPPENPFRQTVSLQFLPGSPAVD